MGHIKFNQFTIIKDLNLPYITSIEYCNISTKEVHKVEHDLIHNKTNDHIYVSDKIFKLLTNEINANTSKTNI